MNQETIDLFMAGLKRLSEEYGIGFEEMEFEAGVTLTDLETGDEISNCIDFEDFKAQYRKPYVPTPIPKTFGPMTKEQWFMHKVQASLKESYMPLIVERLNTPTFLDIAGSHDVSRGIDSVPLTYWNNSGVQIMVESDEQTLTKARATMGLMGYMKDAGYIKTEEIVEKMNHIYTEVIQPFPLPSLEGELKPMEVKWSTKAEIEKLHPRKK